MKTYDTLKKERVSSSNNRNPNSYIQQFVDNIVFTLVLSFLVRVALLLYGLLQDEQMEVKYTDVDYYVFTDAAKLITQVFLVYVNFS